VSGATSESHLWLPFTQMATFDRAERTFVRGFGTTLIDARGRHIFDAISSVWTTIHGHCHPHITAAIARQAGELDHATALGASNPVAEELAERLCALTGLARAFFSSDGASAIEAALKMAIQYWQNIGEPGRTRFVHLRSSYHGDTVGAMSVSDIPLFRSRFATLCFESIPYEDLAATLARDDVAAVIVDPLVQAAAGMRVVPHAQYSALRDGRSADAPAPLLIVDEVATGFGRTGTFFAFTSLGLEPDLLCLGKGITGGTLALSATLATARIYDAFLNTEHALPRHFFHGHSYAANPIACAAALASLEVFEREGTLARVAVLAQHVQRLMGELRGEPAVRDTRAAGLMCGIELDATRVPHAADAASPAWDVANRMYAAGHFTRPIGEVIQLVPPLASTPQELDRFAEALAVALR
jgi:adenosylmethionine-8-amino-7-oxononanoate transaminase